MSARPSDRSPALPVLAAVLLVALALAGCASGSQDPDGDGVPNDIEAQFGTDPNNPDTDGDGLDDKAETVTYVHLGVDPLKADTDGDGLDDFEEVVLYGTDPAHPDPDLDGLTDFEEVTLFAGWDCAESGDPPRCTKQWGLNPSNPDTDQDRWPDAQEVPYWMARHGDDQERAGRNADTTDVDGDGVPDGIDIDPAFDLRVRFDVTEVNLAESFDQEGGADLTLVLGVGVGERTIQVGRVPEGSTALDVNWTHDLDDEGRPTDFEVTATIQALHDESEPIRVNGENVSIVRALPASDYTFQGGGTVVSSGTDGSLTYRVTICRATC